MRTAPIVAVAIATLLLLAGCTGEAGPEPTPSAESRTVERSPDVAAEPALPDIAVGTVVATGTLVPVLGSTSGEVIVTALGGNDYSIDIVDFVSDRADEPDAYLWPDPPGGEVDCSGNLTGAHGINEERSGSGDSAGAGTSGRSTPPTNAARGIPRTWTRWSCVMAIR
ncbi:LptM family lipoprotein [Arenivirga flava]|uniref:DUF5666 domain-containing protein n=1 Tax=Arenivirga flava TaxID=1930060 RepID=A0AA37UHI0_9MICO|nr:hypothetical protein [Arenivirga flava]GMA28943.1 hypothetical protein GCM10025874_21960 [Arenivirga flava]